MKRWRILAIIGMMLAGIIFPQPATKAAAIGQPVRIGLYYGQTAMQEVRLSSASGLTLGTLPSGASMPVPFYSLAGQSSWMVRTDAYRVQFGPYDNLTGARAVLASLPADATRFVVSENDKYFVRFGAYNSLDVALQVLNLISSQPGAAIGPHRVNSALLPDLLAAQALRGAAAAAGFSAALAWTGSGWQVAVGHEVGSEQAEALRGRLASALPAETWTVAAPDLRRSEIYSVEGELLLSVPATDLYIGASGAELGELENPPLVTLHNGATAKRYRGFVELTLQNNAYRVLLYQSLDQYIMGVLPAESYASWPLDAQKAQAITMRNWSESNRGKHASAGFDFCTTTNCQVHTDYSGERAVTQQAVIETAGVLMVYNGKAVSAFFSADAGGYSESVENVWGGSPAPWLKAVPELYPSESSYASWEKRWSGADLSALLQKNGVSIGKVVAIQPTGYSEGGRVMGLRLVDSTGKSVTLSGESALRLYLNLPSRRYSVASDAPPVSVLNADGQVVQLAPSGLKVASASGVATLPSSGNISLRGDALTGTASTSGSGFVFRGSGNGHGAGLSQWGAYAMAKNGHTYEEILKHYFQGIELQKLGD